MLFVYEEAAMQRCIERRRYSQKLTSATDCEALLLGCWTVFLWNLFTFTGERPFAVEGLRLFADGFGNLVHLQVFEYVHTEFARARQIHIAVVVEVGGKELGACAGSAVD